MPDSERQKESGIETIGSADNIYRSYNYVGTKETVAYLLNDVSNSFNIGHETQYIFNVVKIDFGINAIAGLFTGAWDVINDTVIAAIVDNTRTRIGKFRPYLLFMQIPMTLFGLLYWFIPFFFPNTAGTYLPKLIFYYTFNMIRETAGTFTSVAKAGYMSTITPNPNERVRLITLAELLSGYMGEDVPLMIFRLLFDLVNKKKLKIELRTLFMVMGSATSIVSCAFTFYFFLTSRERVPQSPERPDLKAGFKAIFTNYPVLLFCLSRFLEGFSVNTGEDNYWINVFAGEHMIETLKTAVSAISAPLGSVSYAFVAPRRRRFSSKTLWVGADLYDVLLRFGVFFFGLYRNNYRELKPMLAYYGFREFASKLLFGVNKVINVDLMNEAMDYCEWKNGYRMEATAGVARDLVEKIQRTVMNSVNSVVMKRIGYDQDLQFGTQSKRTEFWLFALCSVAPVISGALGIVPKLFWPISKDTRAKMYADLAEQRKRMVEDVLPEEEDAESAAPASETEKSR